MELSTLSRLPRSAIRRAVRSEERLSLLRLKRIGTEHAADFSQGTNHTDSKYTGALMYEPWM